METKETYDYYHELCRVLDVTPAMIGSPLRLAYIVDRRTAIMWALHRKGVPKIGIGRMLHRNHSTVIHSISKVEDWLNYPTFYRQQVALIDRIIEHDKGLEQ